MSVLYWIPDELLEAWIERMCHDEIIEEVRAVREQLGAQKNHDVHMLYDEAKQRQLKRNRKAVRLRPRLLARADKEPYDMRETPCTGPSS